MQQQMQPQQMQPQQMQPQQQWQQPQQQQVAPMPQQQQWQQQPGPGGAASLDHALWLHRRVDVNTWHCYDAAGISHHDARGLAFGSIRDVHGTLVASVAQESLWRN